MSVYSAKHVDSEKVEAVEEESEGWWENGEWSGDGTWREDE